MNFLYKLLIGFFFMFAILGAVFTIIIAHEYSHLRDFKDISTAKQVCVLNLPTSWSAFSDSSSSAGYLELRTDNLSQSDLAKIKQINRYTEIKAYFISALIALFYLVASIIAIKYIVYGSDFERRLK